MKRDYNCESRDNAGRKYAYQFDFDVMHPYMIKSFAPFFKHGEALELGCFQGAFTRRIAGCFEKITSDIYGAIRRLQIFSLWNQCLKTPYCPINIRIYFWCMYWNTLTTESGFYKKSGVNGWRMTECCLWRVPMQTRLPGRLPSKWA